MRRVTLFEVFEDDELPRPTSWSIGKIIEYYDLYPETDASDFLEFAVKLEREFPESESERARRHGITERDAFVTYALYVDDYWGDQSVRRFLRNGVVDLAVREAVRIIEEVRGTDSSDFSSPVAGREFD